MKNWDELAVALGDMSEETFSHHVTINKNDFSKWVRELIGDVTFAVDLQKAATPTTAAKKVEIRLSQLTSKL